MLLVLVYIVSSLWNFKKRFSFNWVKNLLQIYHKISENCDVAIGGRPYKYSKWPFGKFLSSCLVF